jgi:hypothetical protein
MTDLSNATHATDLPLPVIVVYCEGPPHHRHDRYIVAAYQRTHTTPTPGPALWTPLRHYNGVRLRNVEQRRHTTAPGFTDRRAWLGYRFRCSWCPLDEIRVGGDDKIYTVFDGMWRHGVEPLEISVRGLLREIGR